MQVVANKSESMTTQRQTVCHMCEKLEEIPRNDRLERYIQEDEFCDINFTVDGQKLLLHSQVLANRSPVFAKWILDAEFESLVEEALKETKLEYFVEFLDCLYCFDSVTVNGMNAIRLLELAELFDVNFLKTLCIDILVEEVELSKTIHAENCPRRIYADIEYKLRCLNVSWNSKIDRLYNKTIRLLSRYKLADLEKHPLYADLDHKLARELTEERVRVLEPLTERQERNQEKAEFELCNLYEAILNVEKCAESVIIESPKAFNNQVCNCNKADCMQCSILYLAKSVLSIGHRDVGHPTTVNNYGASTAPVAASVKPAIPPPGVGISSYWNKQKYYSTGRSESIHGGSTIGAAADNMDQIGRVGANPAAGAGDRLVIPPGITMGNTNTSCAVASGTSNDLSSEISALTIEPINAKGTHRQYQSQTQLQPQALSAETTTSNLVLSTFTGSASSTVAGLRGATTRGPRVRSGCRIGGGGGSTGLPPASSQQHN